jgi:hypothetical protein
VIRNVHFLIRNVPAPFQGAAAAQSALTTTTAASGGAALGGIELAEFGTAANLARTGVALGGPIPLRMHFLQRPQFLRGLR